MLVVLGVLLAMFSQFGSAIALTTSTSTWLERLQPSPAPTVVTPSPAVSEPGPTPGLPQTTPQDSARPLPEQSVGLVDVTDVVGLKAEAETEDDKKSKTPKKAA